MRTAHVIFGAVQLLFILALFLLSIFLVGLDFAPQLRLAIFRCFAGDSFHFAPLGYVLGGVAFLLLWGLYRLNKTVFYRVSMQPHSANVDTQIIRSYVKDYWEEIFPEQGLTVEVLLHADQQLEVLAEIPEYTQQQQQALLSEIEGDLGNLLQKSLGYNREFVLTLSVKLR